MISVIIPAYNEAERVGNVIQRAKLYADEIVVIDDSSVDETYRIAEQAGARVVKNHEKKGYLGAIKTGFREARGGIIVTMDADGEHNPEEIPLLLRPIFEGKADLVLGKRSSKPRISESFISYLTYLRTGISDSGTGFRAIKRDLALKLNLNGRCICGISVLEPYYSGARIQEVPITTSRIDKKRKIAWEHIPQSFYVLKWIIKSKGERSED